MDPSISLINLPKVLMLILIMRLALLLNAGRGGCWMISILIRSFSVEI